MSKINTIIDSRSWELVRDKLAAIIKAELVQQAAMSYDDYLNCDVYTERSHPITQDEITDTSVVVITSDKMIPQMTTLTDGIYNATFSVLIYTSMPANSSGNGDYNSSIRNQKTAGVIHGILMHPVYVRLDFAPPFIARREVSEIKFGSPQREDSANVKLAIITVDVICSQNEPETSGVLLVGNTTVVKIDGGEKGFKFEIS